METNIVRFRTPDYPSIYAFTFEGDYENRRWTHRSGGSGLVKVGYTTRKVQDRVNEQVHGVDRPVILLDEVALTDSGDTFTDHEVHERMRANGAYQIIGKGLHREWFEATLDEVRIAIAEVRQGGKVRAPNDFPLRPEQQAAVDMTATYFHSHEDSQARHFLWNAKMRFGKTFTAYQLALKMGWQRLLILTYKPAVEDSWRTDLETHQDFEDWQFIGTGERWEDIDQEFPYVWIISFQDIRRKDPSGRIKERLEAAHLIDWDCIILDEYHFGAWNAAAKELYDADQSRSGEDLDVYEPNTFQQMDEMPLNADHWLYLSGTPFRALAEGEFDEDQIFNWTYSDEQAAKRQWSGVKEENPYAELPQLVMMTYRIGDSARKRAERTFNDEFDLNTFFGAKGKGTDARFTMEDDVQDWLDWLHWRPVPSESGRQDAPPFADRNVLPALSHSVWHLPDVASCNAMHELLQRPNNAFFHDYKIICAAGSRAGIGVKALDPLRQAMGDGTRTRTITLTCGKLLTGVTVPQWGAIFMLRDTQSAETYFQAAFRVQSPWSVRNVGFPSRPHVIKHQAYVFDFAPNRALNMIHGYCSRLSREVRESPQDEVRQFLNFLPVLAYDDGKLRQLDETALMDMAASGIGAVMLARRWQSPRMVNLDRAGLAAILNNENLLRSLENMEAFRNLRQYAERIISSDDAVKRVKREGRSRTSALKSDEKDAKKKRKSIEDALLQFLCKVPIFMYLTDYREEALVDIIRSIEPELFTKVTGLRICDFDALCKIGVFNTQLLNPTIYAFRRQESIQLHGSGQDAAQHSAGRLQLGTLPPQILR